MRQIPIGDPDIGSGKHDRADALLDSGRLANWPTISKFASGFGAFCGTEYAGTTANSRTVLKTAVQALELDEGDTVLTAPCLGIARANAHRRRGLDD